MSNGWNYLMHEDYKWNFPHLPLEVKEHKLGNKRMYEFVNEFILIVSGNRFVKLECEWRGFFKLPKGSIVYNKNNIVITKDEENYLLYFVNKGHKEELPFGDEKYLAEYEEYRLYFWYDANKDKMSEEDYLKHCIEKIQDRIKRSNEAYYSFE